MQAPVEITCRNLTLTPSLEAAVQSGVERLDQVCDRIVRCTVAIELPHQRHRHGHTFHVRVEVVVPDRTIVVARDPGHDPSHEDAYVAIADAFRAARRQLLDHAQIVRGEVKQHVA